LKPTSNVIVRPALAVLSAAIRRGLIEAGRAAPVRRRSRRYPRRFAAALLKRQGLLLDIGELRVIRGDSPRPY